MDIKQKLIKKQEAETFELAVKDKMIELLAKSLTSLTYTAYIDTHLFSCSATGHGECYEQLITFVRQQAEKKVREKNKT